MTFLILYSLIALIVSFLLGAAIGGALHSFIAYLQTDRADFARADGAEVLTGSVAAPAFAGAAVAGGVASEVQRDAAPVQIVSDEMEGRSDDDWAEVSRADDAVVEIVVEEEEVAAPLDESELPEKESLSAVEIERAEESVAAPVVVEEEPVGEVEETVAEQTPVVEQVEEAPIVEEVVEQIEPVVEQVVVEETQAEPMVEQQTEYESAREHGNAAAVSRLIDVAEEERQADVVVEPPEDSDDLKQIEYISTGLEKKLNLLGVYKLSQIANWSNDDVERISEELELKDQIIREDWMGAARAALAAGDGGEVVAGFVDAPVEPASDAEQVTDTPMELSDFDSELDLLVDLTLEEKELLRANGATELQDIASWNDEDRARIQGVLKLSDATRLSGWVGAAKAFLDIPQEPFEQLPPLETNVVSSNVVADIPAVPIGPEDIALENLVDLNEEELGLLRANGVEDLRQIVAWSEDDKQSMQSLFKFNSAMRIAGWVGAAKAFVGSGELINDAQVEAPVAAPAVEVEAAPEDQGALGAVVEDTAMEQESGAVADAESAALTDVNEVASAAAAHVEMATSTHVADAAIGAESEAMDELSLDRIVDINAEERAVLEANGVTTLEQIANWSDEDKANMQRILKFDDIMRILGWVGAAKAFVGNGHTEVADVAQMDAPQVMDEPEAEARVEVDEPPAGVASPGSDDLKRIRGLDQEAETVLQELGVSSYDQIAGWEQGDIDRVNEALGTAGRIEREYWVVQAKVLRDGGATEYSRLYDDP